ncbi:hypothetical protein BN182_3590019 [Clostridioides difficile E9]|nr:hypothetical protein BN182_3590019 [Clostridioides difficile E9]
MGFLGLLFCNRLLLSRKWGIDVLRLVGPDAWAQETGVDDVSQHLFKGQPVLFVHRHEKSREHDPQHNEQRPGVADGVPGQQIGGNPHRRPDAEADKLPLGEVKSDFGLDLGKVVGDIYIGHSSSFSTLGQVVPKSRLLMCAEYAPGDGACLEQTEAEQNCVAHTAPNGPDGVAARGDTLYQHRIDGHADED